MRRAAAWLALSLGLAAGVAPAAADDITRTCFQGFCVESREAFTAFNRQAARRLYVLKHSRTQADVYVQAGSDLVFPHCVGLCTVVQVGPEQRAINNHSQQIVGRLIGPITPCGAGEAFSIHLFSFNPDLNLTVFEILRECD